MLKSTFKKSLIAKEVNYPQGTKIKDGNYLAKIRSAQKVRECKVKVIDDKLSVTFNEFQKSIT